MRRLNEMSASASQNVTRSTAIPPSLLSGRVIINADDWGRDEETTNRIRECTLRGAVRSTSAMVFMKDSERAADLAIGLGVDVGLHLNFTTAFSSPHRSLRLCEHQGRLARYLRSSRFARTLFHPALVDTFEYVVHSQLEEFSRIYGAGPARIDGHHHMHLCANVLLANLIPPGTQVRRNFSFMPGEKSWLNRFYRAQVDRRLKSRYRVVDYLFALAPVEPLDRLKRIWSLAQDAVVEIETHPVNPEEYRFLLNNELPLN